VLVCRVANRVGAHLSTGHLREDRADDLEAEERLGGGGQKLLWVGRHGVLHEHQRPYGGARDPSLTEFVGEAAERPGERDAGVPAVRKASGTRCPPRHYSQVHQIQGGHAQALADVVALFDRLVGVDPNHAAAPCDAVVLRRVPKARRSRVPAEVPQPSGTTRRLQPEFDQRVVQALAPFTVEPGWRDSQPGVGHPGWRVEREGTPMDRTTNDRQRKPSSMHAMAPVVKPNPTAASIGWGEGAGGRHVRDELPAGGKPIRRRDEGPCAWAMEEISLQGAAALCWPWSSRRSGLHISEARGTTMPRASLCRGRSERRPDGPTLLLYHAKAPTGNVQRTVGWGAIGVGTQQTPRWRRRTGG